MICVVEQSEEFQIQQCSLVSMEKSLHKIRNWTTGWLSLNITQMHYSYRRSDGRIKFSVIIIIENLRKLAVCSVKEYN